MSAESAFKEFEEKFGKKYESLEERALRLEVFTRNLMHIETLQQSERGTATYSHLTPFADLSSDEFSSRNGFKPELAQPSALAAAPAKHLDVTDLPSAFDWREKGAVNPVQNQGSCGSCWAFSTVANIEGAGFVSSNKLVKLSEQELVDCDTKTGDKGCSGGLPSNAFKDMIQNKIGLESETAYPYAGRDGSCRAVSSDEQVFISGWQKISSDEDQMAAALLKYGPLSIGLNAGPMQWYHGGIANPWNVLCSPKAIDHGVAIVGFGTEGTKKYWTIRNSWGTFWGEKGYWRVIRGVGKCGLNTMVTTATGVSIKGANDTIVV